MTDIPIKIQFLKTLSNLKPSRMIVVKEDSDTDFKLYVTDKQGTPFPIKDLAGQTVTVQNTDGNIDVIGTTNITINISPTLLATINSALQNGDNISELVNDTGYITSFTETDPIFQASEASLFVAGDKVNLDNQSGVNTGDETTASIQTKRPIKTINGDSLEGTGNIVIDYNDLDNIPTLGDLAYLDEVDTNEIVNHAVTNTKLANMTANTVKGRLSGNGTPQDIDINDLLNYKLLTNNTVTGIFTIDYNFDTFNLVLIGNTTLSETNLPSTGFTKTITMYVSGNFAITYPAGWTTFIIGSYDGTKLNQFVIEYRNTGVYFIIINQPD